MRALRASGDITRLGFSFLAAFLDEFSAWLERLLALTAPAPSPDRVTALAMLSLMRLWQGNVDRADAHRLDCLEQSRRLPAAQADPIIAFLDGMHLFLAGSDPRCIGLLGQARDAFDQQDARAEAFKGRVWLAVAAGFVDQDTARQAAIECLAFAKACGGPWSMSWALWAQGRAEGADPGTAIPLLQHALRMMIDMGDQAWSAAICVESIAWVRAAHGQPLHAARLLCAAAGVQQDTGVAVGGPGPFQRERERAIARLRAALGDESYSAAFRQGTELPIEEAYTLALSSLAACPEAPDQASAPPPGTLTTRQQDIARLVAEGLSNAQISHKLHISQRTVENHLGQIFTRLGVRNRAQVAAWITGHALPADTADKSSA